MYVPTAKEFRDIFHIKSAKCVIPKTTREQYAKYVAGSYLLYIELQKIDKKLIAMTFKSKKEKIVISTGRVPGWQTFINPLGTPMSLECSYVDKHKGITPFWTYTKFDKNDLIPVTRMAYQLLNNELNKIKSKYQSKYLIDAKWRNFVFIYGLRTSSDYMAPVWLDGVNFISDLAINVDNTLKFIGDYTIKQSITNRTNIWDGDILPAVQKIINSVTP